ncbi:MAG: hypothetical protein GXP42_19870 [Chloroflexi bacterium]|nr:hypothetical protein [Chloroflexota bacterium]
MKTSELKKRLRKNRPMRMISLRIPEDVLEDLKRVAPLRGFSGYQPLMRAYIGQGLRADLERLHQEQQKETVQMLIESLRKRGVDNEVLDAAVSELRERGPIYRSAEKEER